jgi:hypothetical protein
MGSNAGVVVCIAVLIVVSAGLVNGYQWEWAGRTGLLSPHTGRRAAAKPSRIRSRAAAVRELAARHRPRLAAVPVPGPAGTGTAPAFVAKDGAPPTGPELAALLTGTYPPEQPITEDFPTIADGTWIAWPFVLRPYDYREQL